MDDGRIERLELASNGQVIAFAEQRSFHAADDAWCIADDGSLLMAEGSRLLRLAFADGLIVPETMPLALGRGRIEAVCTNGRGGCFLALGGELHEFDLDHRRAVGDVLVHVAGVEWKGRRLAEFGAPPVIELPARPGPVKVMYVASIGLRSVECTFSLRLDDAAWSLPSATGTVEIADPGRGTHVLRTRVMDAQGRVVANGADLHIVVRAHWSETIAFRALAVFMFVASLYGLYRIALNRRLRAQQRVHEQELALQRERARIASDLHDDLGSGLSMLKVRSELALADQHPERMEGALTDLGAEAQDLLDNMRHIVWAMSGGQEKLSDLLAYMRGYAVPYLEENGIACRFEPPAGYSDRDLSIDERRNVFLIMKEALHNVVRHAHARSVHVQVEVDNGLRMRIADDGVGFDSGNGHVGNGTRTMAERAQALGGALRTEAAAPGTCVVLNVPRIGMA
jgi:signal transduction histidine kinase